jgi:hypothetical protein
MNKKQMDDFFLSTASGPVLAHFLSWYQPMTMEQHKRIMIRCAPWLGVARVDTK